MNRLVFIAFLTGAAAFASKPPSKVALHNFEKWRPILQASDTFNVVDAGGWYLLTTLSENPKQDLVNAIMDQPKELDGYITKNNEIISHGRTQKDATTSATLKALIALLEAQGKGYDSDLVDGEWISVLTMQGKKSPRIQKLVGMAEKKRATSFANFTVKDGTFVGTSKLLRGKCNLQSTVKFHPISDNFSIIDKKIVLRRISCDIVGASLKFWKLPRIPLPLRRKGGYLDFVYLDRDLRITRGNRGGLFIHFRPAFLQTLMTLRQVEGADI